MTADHGVIVGDEENARASEILEYLVCVDRPDNRDRRIRQ